MKQNGKNKLDRLVAPSRRKSFNPVYSRLVRWLRLILPLLALAIMAVIFTWSSFYNRDFQVIEQVAIPQYAGKNEVLNARFQSRDEKNQPYTISAARALQAKANEDLILLEKPVADIVLTNGSWLAIKAVQGAYRQDIQRLFLKENVELFHDKGYQLETEELNIDLDLNLAWTDLDVAGHGPAGTLTAKGMQADQGRGLLTFKGPAKLVLFEKAAHLDFRGPQP